PKRGPGFILYWLHDVVYLPFVGYAWTLYFPTSLVWWVLASFLFVIFLATFLTGASVIRRPHEWLCRLTIRTLCRLGWFRSLLLKAIKVFGRLKLGAELLAESVRLERFRALLAVVHAPRGSGAAASSAKTLIRLTEFYTAIQLRARADEQQLLWALVLWQQSMLWAVRRAAPDELRELAPRLRKSLKFIIGRLPRS